MSDTHFDSPREAARAFTPTLSAFVDDTLYPRIWSDPTLSPRDRSLVTVAALIAGGPSRRVAGAPAPRVDERRNP